MEQSRLIKFLSKKSTKIILAILFTFVLAELMLRALFYFRVGPDIFFYGTSFYKKNEVKKEKKANKKKKSKGSKHNLTHSDSQHKNIKENYSKYFPHQKRMDADQNGEIFSVTINSQGFRGREFIAKKKPGVFRIVTLGASSTFGFLNRDNETYSYHLESFLNKKLKESPLDNYKAVEVINMGIPHLKSDQIYSLFVHEALPLAPDLVTFYEGANDATVVSYRVREKGIKRFFYQTFKSLAKRFLAFLLFYEVVLQKRLLYYERDYLNYKDDKAKNFIKNLGKINAKCKEKNIRFVMVTQQCQSRSVSQRKNLTYAQEVIFVKKEMQKGIRKRQLIFLLHNELVIAQKKWAKQNEISLIDGIEALDQHRENLLTWVHLSPKGNRILAKSMSEGIYPLIKK